jgi:hypothetical protein
MSTLVSMKKVQPKSVDEQVEQAMKKLNAQLEPQLREAIKNRSFGQILAMVNLKNGKITTGEVEYRRTFLIDQEQ